MRAETQTINGIVRNDVLLRIPYFQRRYVWDEENWQRFADDMESVVDDERKYFLGAIILKDETEECNNREITSAFQVVDGQQRLTTLCIYMKVLHLLTNRNDNFNYQYLQDNGVQDPVIEHNCEDRPSFADVMHKDIPSEIANANNHILQAYNFFFNKLNGKNNNFLNNLLTSVRGRVTFVMITLQSEDDEQRTFETLNSLGVPLSTDELVKNFLYRSNDAEAYKNDWKPVFDTDNAREFWGTDASKSRQQATKNNTVVEKFFHAFVRIKMWDFDLDEKQKKNFVKQSNVFETCKAFVNDFGMERMELAKEIIEYAKLFRAHIDKSILDDRIPMYAGIERISCFINATDNTSVTPYVLYILRNVKDYNERQLIFDYLESYLVRRVLAESNNNSYSDLFTENLINGHQHKTAASLKNYIQKRDPNANLAMPNDRKIQDKLDMRKKEVGEKMARIVYYLYETKRLKPSDPKSVDGGFNNYLAFQMMPKSPNSNWPREQGDAEDLRKQAAGTFGNFFLLEEGSKKDMKKCDVSSFDDKKKVMIQYSQKIGSNNILNDNQTTTWTKEDIAKRNATISSIFCSIWSA